MNKGTHARDGTAFKACIVGSKKLLINGETPVNTPNVVAAIPPKINP